GPSLLEGEPPRIPGPAQAVRDGLDPVAHGGAEALVALAAVEDLRSRAAADLGAAGDLGDAGHVRSRKGFASRRPGGPRVGASGRLPLVTCVTKKGFAAVGASG